MISRSQSTIMILDFILQGDDKEYEYVFNQRITSESMKETKMHMEKTYGSERRSRVTRAISHELKVIVKTNLHEYVHRNHVRDSLG